MSEQKQSFMQELDAWTDQAIIEPLFADGEVIGVEANVRIHRAIRQKVLESYRNGQAAGNRTPVRKESRK